MDYADQNRQEETPELGSEPQHPPRLLDRVRSVIRTLQYSIRTEDAYVP